MSDRISRRQFVWLCLGAAGTACTVLTGCSNEVAAEESPATVEAAPTAFSPTAVPPTAAPAAATTQPIAAEPTTEPTVVFVSRCPKGLVNDPYPGRCGRYIDSNGDGICDLSQPL